MTDEKILAVYQQVRSRYNFLDYWEKIIATEQSLSSIAKCSKADEALNRDVVVAFAKEIALWWGAES
jgi:hypothetical protein